MFRIYELICKTLMRTASYPAFNVNCELSLILSPPKKFSKTNIKIFSFT